MILVVLAAVLAATLAALHADAGAFALALTLAVFVGLPLSPLMSNAVDMRKLRATGR